MKKAAAAAIFLLTVSAHAGVLQELENSPLARELQFTQHAIDTQLKNDHAPDQLRKQEMTLLSNAEAALKGAKVGAAGHHMSLLANRQGQGSSTALALSAKVEHEIGFAERAVQVQLEQDHAPAALVKEEKDLLSQAEAAIHRSSALQSKLSLLKKSKPTVSVLSSKKEVKQASKAGALQAFAAGMAKMVSSETSRLEETKALESQTKKVLQQTHMDAKTQKKVADLLAQAESFEHQELDTARHSMESESVAVAAVTSEKKAKVTTLTTEQAFQAYAKGMQKVVKDETSTLGETKRVESETKKLLKEAHTDAKTQSTVEDLLAQAEKFESQSLNAATHQLAATTKEESSSKTQTLAGLETSNVELRSKNTELKLEHAKLLREQKLFEANSAMEQKNRVLSTENAALEQKLAEEHVVA